MALMLPGGGAQSGVRIEDIGSGSGQGLDAALIKLQSALAVAKTEGASAQKVAEINAAKDLVAQQFGLTQSMFSNLDDLEKAFGGRNALGIVGGGNFGPAFDTSKMQIDQPYMARNDELDQAAQSADIFAKTGEGAKSFGDTGLRMGGVDAILGPTGVTGPTEELTLREQMESRERQAANSAEKQLPIDMEVPIHVPGKGTTTMHLRGRSVEEVMAKQKALERHYGSPTSSGAPVAPAQAGGNTSGQIKEMVQKNGLTETGPLRDDGDGVMKQRAVDSNNVPYDVFMYEGKAYKVPAK